MATFALKNAGGAPISSEIIQSFSGGIAGKVIRPQDPEYNGARRIWNSSISKHPGLIVRCAGTADVVQAVKFARASELLVAIRGGGHNVAGRALCDDGLVIDLSGMRAVFVDPAKRTAAVLLRLSGVRNRVFASSKPSPTSVPRPSATTQASPRAAQPGSRNRVGLMPRREIYRRRSARLEPRDVRQAARTLAPRQPRELEGSMEFPRQSGGARRQYAAPSGRNGGHISA